MRKNENAPPAGTGKRADECVLGKQSRSNSGEHCQRAMPRTLDAAVISAYHPEARLHANVARGDAHFVTVGGATIGYWSVPRRRGRYSRCAHRLTEIEKLFRDRYPVEDGVVPSRPMAIAFADMIAVHAPERDALKWIKRNIVSTGEIDNEDAHQIVGEAVQSNRYWSDDEIGERLQVTRVERETLGITAIGAIDFNERQRKLDRRKKDRNRKRAKRAMVKCGTSRPISAAQRRPWEAARISRSRWYALGLNRKDASNVAGGGTESVGNIYIKGVADKNSPDAATLVLRAITEPMQVSDLVELMGMSHRIVRPILSRLRSAGLAAPVSRGVWQATDTDAGGPKAAAQAPATPAKMNRPIAAEQATDTSSIKTKIPSKRSSYDDHRASTTSHASIDRVAAALRLAIAKLEAAAMTAEVFNKNNTTKIRLLNSGWSFRRGA